MLAIKQLKMNKMIKLAGIAAVVLCLTQSIYATSIIGSIGFSGSVVYNNGTDPGTATAVTSWISPVVSGVTGTFATPSPFAIANHAPVTFAHGNWNFNTPTTSPINNFWSVGGFMFELLTSFVVTEVPTEVVSGVTIYGYVVVDGTGMVSGNGYTPTVMSWTFSSYDPATGSNPTSWTFGAQDSTLAAPSAVPDGGSTVLLLGLGLAGVALLRKKLKA
jgi:hypothetical protein